MSITLIDFCGFQFNGVHSSTLDITRVSNGSRYEDELVPAFQDKTAQIEGGDGTLFWESFYSQKPITIQIAYDGLSEEKLRKLRQVFNGKDMGELIFDEEPYKAYTVKVQSPPHLQYICFDKTVNSQGESRVERVYKGEGTIQFIAYYPYAKSVKKYLDQFPDADYPNKPEWKTASGMLETQDVYDGTGANIHLYNAGDIEADWQAFYEINQSGRCPLSSITLATPSPNSQTEGVMAFSTITQKKQGDVYIRINSRTNLIEGCNSSKEPTGTLYNEFLTAGDFFKIPLGKHEFNSSGVSCAEIRYNYLYY